MTNENQGEASINGHANGLRSSTSDYIVPLLIDGKEIQTETAFDVVDPGTDKIVWKSSSASKKDAINAAEAAHAAFPAWSKTKPAARRDIFLKAADILASREEELVKYDRVQTGSSEYAARRNITSSVEQLRDVACRLMTVHGDVAVCGEEGKSALILKEPYGVILGISPWNAPYILGFRAASNALAGGNTVVLKGAEASPRCTWAIGSVFQEAGLPDGCLNVIHHRPQDAAEITTALIEHPAVKKINFTGSTAVGSIIAATAGKNLKPVLMELGGKASAIVLHDADIGLAAQRCAEGAFAHGGQICMSTERILVHSSIIGPFSQALKSAISTIYPSQAPAQILVSPVGVTKNKKLVTQAISQGAKLAYGDPNAKETSSTRMRPLVVEGVHKKMDIYYQESFGPTVSLFEVASEEEAIAIANDTEYGLSAAIFTKNLATGLRVAKQIESGAVHINDSTVHDEPALPHGGFKKSGFGRFNASAGIEEFLRLKTVTWQD